MSKPQSTRLALFAEQERKLQRYIMGETCIGAFRSYSSMIVLDFRLRHPPEPNTPDNYREPDRSVVIENCAWQIKSGADVLVGSANDDEVIDEQLPICIGKRVAEIVVFPPSYMFCLHFTEGLSLWVFPDSSGSTNFEGGNRLPWFVVGRAVH